MIRNVLFVSSLGTYNSVYRRSLESVKGFKFEHHSEVWSSLYKSQTIPKDKKCIDDILKLIPERYDAIILMESTVNLIKNIRKPDVENRNRATYSGAVIKLEVMPENNYDIDERFNAQISVYSMPKFVENFKSLLEQTIEKAGIKRL